MIISIYIPDDQVTRIVNAFAVVDGYDMGKLPGETKAEFAKRMMRKSVLDRVKASEIPDAQKGAAAQVIADVETIAITAT